MAMKTTVKLSLFLNAARLTLFHEGIVSRISFATFTCVPCVAVRGRGTAVGFGGQAA